MIFKNADERKQHPQAGLIPDNVWNQYFICEINDRLLDIMTAKPEELLEKINDISRNFSSNDGKAKIFSAVVSGHSDLNLNTFDEILQDIHYNDSPRMFENVVGILTSNTSNNDKYLKHVLTNVNNKMDFAIAFYCAAKNDHIKALEYLEEKHPSFLQNLQAMIKADNYAAFKSAADNGHANVLNFLMPARYDSNCFF